MKQIKVFRLKRFYSCSRFYTVASCTVPLFPVFQEKNGNASDVTNGAI